MYSNTPSRRLFIKSAGVVSAVTIAGCLGDDSADDETPDDSTNNEAPNGSTNNDTSNGEESIFVNYGINYTDLSVEITEDVLSQVAEIQVGTPTEQKTVELSETITDYSIDILRDRAGTWYIDALDSNGEAIETIEMDTTFNVSVDEVGTLAQLGVTGRSPVFEEMGWQVTVTNTGDVPVEPSQILIDVPDLDYGSERAAIGGLTGGIETYEGGVPSGVVDRDGEVVIVANDSNTYRRPAGGSTTNLLSFETDRAEELAGQSFPAELNIQYQAEREDTVIPISIELGNQVVRTDSSTVGSYLEGSSITMG
jgi:hypothetical protein